MTEKKVYESPKAEKLDFDFNTNVVASGVQAGAGNFVYGEDNTTGGIVYRASAGYCTIFHDDDGCMGC